MKLKHIGRTLVCLLLVCCLLINISPIRAKATGATAAVVYGVAAATVITATFIALGLSQGDSPTDFDYAVDSCKQFLAESTEFLTNGKEAAVVWVAGQCFASAQFINAVHNWLFDSETVSLPRQAHSGGTYTFSDGYAVTYPAQYYTVRFNYADAGKGNVVRYVDLMVWTGTNYGSTDSSGTSLSPPIMTVNDTRWRYVYRSALATSSSASLFIPGSAALNTTIAATELGVTTKNAIEYAIANLVMELPDAVTSYDLVVNSLKAPSVSIATGYADWAAGAISVPGSMVGIDEEEETLVYPLGFGQTYEETRDMTQAEVQSGTGSYVDTKTEVLTGTFADTAIGTFISSLIDALWTPFRWIGEQIAAIPSAFAGWFTDVITGIRSIPDVITSAWDAAVASVLAGVQAIFVPTEDFLTVKVEALRAEFPFMAPIIETGQFIGSAMSGFETSPPVIYIDLSADRGSFDLGGVVPFIDLTWYAEYKPTVDQLLSALLWIVFCWKMFKRLPGLIAGLPGDFVMDGLNTIGMADHLPSRNVAYEVQRMSIRDSVRRRGK